MSVIKYVFSKDFRKEYSKDLRNKVNFEFDANEKAYKKDR